MNSKIYAGISLALYIAVVVVVFLFVELSPRPMAMQQNDVMYVEFIEPEIPPKPEPPQEYRATKPSPPIKNPDPKMQQTSPHEEKAPEEHSEQTAGPAEVTRTVNQKALFQMPKDGVDEPADVGNVAAEQGEKNEASGENPLPGLSPEGEVEGKLDSGLKGRGCDYLPKPTYPSGNNEGIVVVRVTVNASGEVENPVYEPMGSTTNNAELKAAALAAAKRARFNKLDDLTTMQGTITYVFKLKK